MNLIHELSFHRLGGWQGQYDRIIRWRDKFNSLTFDEKNIEKAHEYLDFMYACFQSIFHLKDWLIQESSIKKDEVFEFINSNKEIGICRDICNGTKHYNITSPSVDEKFGFIRSYNPFHKQFNSPKWNVVLCAGGETYKPIDLINKCIILWNEFIALKLNLNKS